MRSTLALVVIAGLAALTVFATEGGSTGLRPARADSLITRGKLLYSSYSCRGCHTIDGRGNAGPTFKHLYGSRVKLTTGRTVIANDAYLLRAILDPNAHGRLSRVPRGRGRLRRPEPLHPRVQTSVRTSARAISRGVPLS